MVIWLLDRCTGGAGAGAIRVAARDGTISLLTICSASLCAYLTRLTFSAQRLLSSSVAHHA